MKQVCGAVEWAARSRRKSRKGAKAWEDGDAAARPARRAAPAPPGSTLREIVTPDGRLFLTATALSAVVRGAALRCAGVVDTIPRGLPGEIRGLWRHGGESSDWGALGVDVDLDGEHLEVTVDIIVRFGVHIPSVVTAVFAAVASDLQTQAGVSARRVHVRVGGVLPGAGGQREPPRPPALPGPADRVEGDRRPRAGGS